MFSPGFAADYCSRENFRLEQQSHSPLGRAHLRVTLDANLSIAGSILEFAQLSQSQLVAALVDKAARWLHVETLNLRYAASWSESDAIAFLRSPALRRVRSVDHACGAWLSSSVQSALCRLPGLSSLGVRFHSHPSCRLHPSVLAHATALRRLRVVIADGPPCMLAGLVCAPQLSSLTLEMRGCFRHREVPEPGLSACLMLHCRPMLSQLRALRLGFFNPQALTRQAIHGLLCAMPALRYLETDSWHPNWLLRGLTDAGVAALPDLRVVRYSQDQSGSSGGDGCLGSRQLRAFLSAFPLVHYCLSLFGDGDDRECMLRRFAKWPQVCTAPDHTEPDADGRLESNCVEDPERAVVGADTNDENAESDSEDDGEGSGSDEEEDDGEGQQNSLADPADTAAPLLTPAESLRLIELEYQRELAKRV